MALVALLGGVVPPLWVVVLTSCAYLGVLALGSLVPSLEMYGDVLHRLPEAGPCVALTFDDGPDPETTIAVLDQLRERGHRATFFVLGVRAEAHPEILRRMVDDGHAIGLHSYDHDRLYAFLPPSAVERDIERCRDAVERAVGQRPVWFRPPVGQTSPRTHRGVAGARAEIVGWSARGRDGLRGTTADDVLVRLTPKLVPGAILLLHDAWERPSESSSEPPAGVRALPVLLDRIEERGLQTVTLDELVERASGVHTGSTTTKRAPGA